MSHVTYKIVQHDGGWAYTVDGVFSESFATHAAALAAAKRAASEQRTPGRTEMIEYETAGWRGRTWSGGDAQHGPPTHIRTHHRPRPAYVRPNRPADDPPRRPSDMKQFTRKPSWKPWVSGVNRYSWHRVGLIWTA